MCGGCVCGGCVVNVYLCVRGLYGVCFCVYGGCVYGVFVFGCVCLVCVFVVCVFVVVGCVQFV